MKAKTLIETEDWRLKAEAMYIEACLQPDPAAALKQTIERLAQINQWENYGDNRGFKTDGEAWFMTFRGAGHRYHRGLGVTCYFPSDVRPRSGERGYGDDEFSFRINSGLNASWASCLDKLRGYGWDVER